MLIGFYVLKYCLTWHSPIFALFFILYDNQFFFLLLWQLLAKATNFKANKIKDYVLVAQDLTIMRL